MNSDGLRLHAGLNENVHIVARRPGHVLVGGLGALGVGQMWFPEEQRHREYPGYDEAEQVDPNPQIACPNCGGLQPDEDGFGFLYCPGCGHCTHPSATGDGQGGWICDACGKASPA